ncbi:endonuclease SmrB [Idiomarina xiamenensis]|uniref:Ribosome rescue factor SmrB n=1 Tax=Idiomarina xiamenensis 10-D-4 TaxID=740709 RepID=K2JHE3_9GAMM|nr:endonuclease SmrB [Idiomarina xiamenensis]EKE82751.1 hypothetical protein A10D4_09104 [Idiomarina xiamenensis 10-D-4]
MKNSDQQPESDATLFRQSVKGTRRLKQDKVVHPPAKKRQSPLLKQQHERAQRNASHHFSDVFEAHFGAGPLKYIADGEDPYLAKQLRRGDFEPDLLLDLHGLTQAQAKRELAALLASCERELVACCSIMHGYGEGVLKQRVPHWLVQHPLVRAFHQAPQAWGGDAAILVLLRVQS